MAENGKPRWWKPEWGEDGPGVDASLSIRRAYILAKTRAIQRWIADETKKAMDGASEDGSKEPARLTTAIASASQAMSRALNDEAKRLGVDKMQEGEGDGGEAQDAAKWRRE